MCRGGVRGPWELQLRMGTGAAWLLCGKGLSCWGRLPSWGRQATVGDLCMAAYRLQGVFDPWEVLEGIYGAQHDCGALCGWWQMDK